MSVQISESEVSEALEKSIKHWEENAKVLKLSDVKIGRADCALCGLFNDFNNCFGCNGCPVFEKTGRRYCDRTPYVIANIDRKRWSYAIMDNLSNKEREKARLKFQESALKEVEFLKSLRKGI